MSHFLELRPLDGVAIAIKEFIEQSTNKTGCFREYFILSMKRPDFYNPVQLVKLKFNWLGWLLPCPDE